MLSTTGSSLACIPANNQLINPDILIIPDIFRTIVTSYFLENVYQFDQFNRFVDKMSLVCTRWKVIIETDAVLWKFVLAQLGIPIPSHLTATMREVYAYQTTPLLANKTRACCDLKMEETTLHVDLSRYDAIQFLEDTHLIAHWDHGILIYNLEKHTTKMITPPSSIVSLCVAGGGIYVGLNNQVVAYSVEGENKEALFTLDLPVGENSDKMMTVLANDKYIVSITSQLVIWHRGTGKLHHIFKLNSCVHCSFQIDSDKLYYMVLTPDIGLSLFYYDLNLNGGEIFLFRFGPFVESVHVRGNLCTFINKGISLRLDGESADEDVSSEITEVIDESELEAHDSASAMQDFWDEGALEFSEPLIDETQNILTLNLSTQKIEHRHRIRSLGCEVSPGLVAFDGLAFLMTDDHDAEDSDDEFMTNSSSTLTLIDLETGKTLHTIQQPHVNYKCHWPISIFQDKIMIATDEKFLIVTPSPSKKRKRIHENDTGSTSPSSSNRHKRTT